MIALVLAAPFLVIALWIAGARVAAWMRRARARVP